MGTNSLRRIIRSSSFILAETWYLRNKYQDFEIPEVVNLSFSLDQLLPGHHNYDQT